MKLKTYKNLYAYYVHTELIKGSEVSLQYSRATKSYSVVLLEKYSPVSIKSFNTSYDAKTEFRRLLNNIKGNS